MVGRITQPLLIPRNYEYAIIRVLKSTREADKRVRELEVRKRGQRQGQRCYAAAFDDRGRGYEPNSVGSLWKLQRT